MIHKEEEGSLVYGIWVAKSRKMRSIDGFWGRRGSESMIEYTPREREEETKGRADESGSLMGGIGCCGTRRRASQILARLNGAIPFCRR